MCVLIFSLILPDPLIKYIVLEQLIRDVKEGEVEWGTGKSQIDRKSIILIYCEVLNPPQTDTCHTKRLQFHLFMIYIAMSNRFKSFNFLQICLDVFVVILKRFCMPFFHGTLHVTSYYLDDDDDDDDPLFLDFHRISNLSFFCYRQYLISEFRYQITTITNSCDGNLALTLFMILLY